MCSWTPGDAWILLASLREAAPQVKTNSKSNGEKKKKLECSLTTSCEPDIFNRVRTILGEPLICVLSTELEHLKNIINNYFGNEQKILTKCQFLLWPQTKDSEIQSWNLRPLITMLAWRPMGSSSLSTWYRRDREILYRNILLNIFILTSIFEWKRQMYFYKKSLIYS